MNKVIIQTQLKLEEFVALNYAIYFKRTGTRIMLTIFSLMLLTPFVMYFTWGFFEWTPAIISLAVITMNMVMINVLARKSYNTNKQIAEPVTYDFRDERLLITNESSHNNLAWNKVYKVTLTKACLVIYQSAQTVNCIPRRDMNDADLAIIKSIIQQNKVRNDLK